MPETKARPAARPALPTPEPTNEVAVQETPPDPQTAAFQALQARLRTPIDELSKPGVVIVGFTDHRKEAYRWSADHEIWGLNELYRYEPIEKFDRWFEIHDRDVIDQDPPHIQSLSQMDIPVYMQRRYEDLPSSLPFPKEFVEQFVGKLADDDMGGEYWGSSPAWMTGLAIAMGAQSLKIVGIDLAQDTEYAHQRPNMEYVLGIARGLGIPVYIPEMSDLLKAVGQYGFGETGGLFRRRLTEREQWLHRQDNEHLAKLRALESEFRTKMKGLKREYRTTREAILANRWQIFGAIMNTGYIKRSWSVPGDGDPTQPNPDRSQDPQTAIGDGNSRSRADNAGLKLIPIPGGKNGEAPSGG